MIGEGRPFLVAVIVVNNTMWEQFAEENDARADQPNAPSLTIKVLARIEHVLSGFPRHAQVRAIYLTRQPWTVEAGLLTPTLKVKRDILQRVFATEIEQLYAGHQLGQ